MGGKREEGAWEGRERRKETEDGRRGERGKGKEGKEMNLWQDTRVILGARVSISQTEADT